MLALLLGCGAFILYDSLFHEEIPDDVALCEVRGGEWVNNAEVPLCMTPDEGLLKLINGSFVAYSSADPWTEQNNAPLAGKTLGEEEKNISEYPKTSEICKEERVEKYTGKIAPVDFSSWQGSTEYRTAIIKDVVRGVNFAGTYVVSTWGCGRKKGDACVGHAIIDARTGRILLYGAIGKQTADFSLESNQISLVLQKGEVRRWAVMGDDHTNLVLCRE
jgi:hypothetical protein